MKKTIMIMMIISAMIVTSKIASAQAWEKSTRVISIGVSASQYYHIDTYYYSDSRNYHSWYSPVTAGLTIQGEFGVHKYIGIGFTTGFGGRGRLRDDYNGEINIPIGAILNFHFYQLIADKSSKNIHADKLDIYAGCNMGSGLAIGYYTHTHRAMPILWGGVQLGIRYYFTPAFGVNLEAGLGKNLVNAGVSLKF